MSSRARAAVLVLVLSILLTGCGNVEPTIAPAIPSATPLSPTATPSPLMASPAASSTSLVDLSPGALAYLEEALDIMQEHSINQEQIDWDRLRARARSRALGAHTPADTHNAIRFALRDLGDHHSHFMTPEQVAELENGTMNLSSPIPAGGCWTRGSATS